MFEYFFATFTIVSLEFLHYTHTVHPNDVDLKKKVCIRNK